MSTQDIPDNELDDFFRKSLKEPEIDFREEDWLQMENKLDAAVKQKRIFRRNIYALLALLLGTTVSVLLWLNNSRSDTLTDISAADTYTENAFPADNKQKLNNNNSLRTPASSQQSAEDEGKVANQTKTRQTTNATQEIPATTKEAISDETITEAAIQIQNVETKATANKSNKTDKGNMITEQNGQARNTTTGLTASYKGELVGKEYDADPFTNIPADNVLAEKTRSGKRKTMSTTPTFAGKTNLTPGTRAVTKRPVLGNRPVVTGKDEWLTTSKPSVGSDEYWQESEYTGTDTDWPLLPLTQVPLQPLVGNSQLDKRNEELKNTWPDVAKVSLPADSIAVKKLSKERMNYRFMLSFVISPDISTVRLSDLTKPGTNVGMLLSYQISRRFSVSTGLIRSAKVYDAYIGDYSPPPGQWTYYVEPVEIKASCIVLDIPVNIRYNFLMKQHYNLYVTAGLSSYLMKSEKYRYIYDVDDTYLRKSWEVVNENKHYFKVYNLSAGYERKLSKRFSAGAEPFVKIPGAGVGFGKIHLWTAGLFVSANYKLGK